MIYRSLAIGIAIAALAVGAAAVVYHSRTNPNPNPSPNPNPNPTPIPTSLPYRAIVIIGATSEARAGLATQVEKNVGYRLLVNSDNLINQMKESGCCKFTLIDLADSVPLMQQQLQALSQHVQVDAILCIGGADTSVETLLASRRLHCSVAVVSPSQTYEEMYQEIKSKIMYKVIFVLGGPGAGKGTQCARLTASYPIAHLSAGDLLRDEQKAGGEIGEMIKAYIKEGKIVPAEVTVSLLQKAIFGCPFRVILVDGFPRSADNLNYWLQGMENSCEVCYVLFLDCSEEEMESRLLERGKTSGRADDNIESIRKRFRTYREQTVAIIESFAKQKKVRQISANRPVDVVYQETSKVVQDVFSSFA